MQVTQNHLPDRIFCPELPLSVYREIVAHLRQVEGVEAELLPQESTQFEYRQSQVGGLSIRYDVAMDADSRQRVTQILAYYGDRHGSWQMMDR